MPPLDGVFHQRQIVPVHHVVANRMSPCPPVLGGGEEVEQVVLAAPPAQSGGVVEAGAGRGEMVERAIRIGGERLPRPPEQIRLGFGIQGTEVDRLPIDPAAI